MKGITLDQFDGLACLFNIVNPKDARTFQKSQRVHDHGSGQCLFRFNIQDLIDHGFPGYPHQQGNPETSKGFEPVQQPVIVIQGLSESKAGVEDRIPYPFLPCAIDTVLQKPETSGTTSS